MTSYFVRETYARNLKMFTTYDNKNTKSYMVINIRLVSCSSFILSNFNHCYLIFCIHCDFCLNTRYFIWLWNYIDTQRCVKTCYHCCSRIYRYIKVLVSILITPLSKVEFTLSKIQLILSSICHKMLKHMQVTVTSIVAIL